MDRARPTYRTVLRRVVAVAVSAVVATTTLVLGGHARPVSAAEVPHHVVRVAGGGVGDSGPALDALVAPSAASDVVSLLDGRLAFYDRRSRQVRVLEADGSVSALYGSGGPVGDYRLPEFDGADAVTVALPPPSAMSVTGDGALWLRVNFGFLRIDPGTHRISARWVPVPRGSFAVDGLLVRRDGSLVLRSYDGTDHLWQAAPGWPGSRLTLMADRAPGLFAETTGGTLYESYGGGIYRHRSGAMPLLVAGRTTFGVDETPDGSPAVGAAMAPKTLAADDSGRIAYGEGQRVRVVSGGTVRTVASSSDLDPRLRCGRFQPARVHLRGTEVVLACQESLRSAPADGTDPEYQGRMLAGLGERAALDAGSPSGTPALQGYLGLDPRRMALSPATGRLQLASSRDLREIRPTSSGDVVDVVATLAPATQGLDWSADDSPNAHWWPATDLQGRLVAVVCQGWGQFCVLRRQQPDGSWRTVQQPGEAVPGERLMTIPWPWTPDAANGRVWFGTDAGDGRVLRVLDLTTDTVTDVGGLLGTAEQIAVLPDGRLIVALPGATTGVVIDPALPDVTAPTGLPTSATWSVAPDGTVWAGTTSSLERRRLDGTVVETVDPAAAGAVWGAHRGSEVFERFSATADGVHVQVRGTAIPTAAVYLLTRGPTVPTAPATPTAVRGAGSAAVGWGAAAARGSAITAYVVTARPGGHSVTVAAAARSATVTGLTPGTSYRFTVTATSAVGQGPGSRESLPVTVRATAGLPPVVLGPPWGSTSTATLTWTPPTDAGYADVVVVHKQGRTVPTSVGDGRVVYQGRATSTTVTGLAVGVHSIAVFARDSDGTTSRPAAVRARVTDRGGWVMRVKMRP